jgi:dual oxidase
MYEYLPVLFDEPMPPYNGYKPDTHPGVSHVFQSAAFRFGHTMIPPGLYRRSAITYCLPIDLLLNPIVK